MSEERLATVASERPIEAGEAAGSGPPHLTDPRALQILSTEHWSLLTSRSLVYNEAFARAGMFMTFLSASLVALGFLSQGSGFGRDFLVATAALLGVDLLVGLATLGRVSAASTEEFRALQAMNRIRHAYLEMVPTLEPYFSSGWHDDPATVLAVYGATPERPNLGASFLHGLTTTPGMVSMINAVIAGSLIGVLAMLADLPSTASLVGGAIGGFAFFGLVWLAATRRFAEINRSLEIRFPPSTD
ncbi:MAG TPA: hypothetical protein VFK54_11165 [Candidatus Limnocylindrales bacterium]|nr:hypothetical protein [Candidatus Limnocylindrales bacterium]